MHAYGEAAALLERALELWDRVPDAPAVAGAEHVELLLRAGRAHSTQPDVSRAVPLYELALEQLDADADPVRYAGALGELAGAQWSLGRGDDSRATLDRALELLPDDRPTRERANRARRAGALPDAPGPFHESIEAAHDALAAADAADVPAVRGRVLNRLGTSLFHVGEPEQGAAAMRDGHRAGPLATAPATTSPPPSSTWRTASTTRAGAGRLTTPPARPSTRSRTTAAASGGSS